MASAAEHRAILNDYSARGQKRKRASMGPALSDDEDGEEEVWEQDFPSDDEKGEGLCMNACDLPAGCCFVSRSHLICSFPSCFPPLRQR